VNRLLDGFEGKLTSSKRAKLSKCSQDTANRDINDLVQRGILTGASRLYRQLHQRRRRRHTIPAMEPTVPRHASTNEEGSGTLDTVIVMSPLELG
jgi:DeoR/GlpR family transcriptional regulator of sugar metabolism